MPAKGGPRIGAPSTIAISDEVAEAVIRPDLGAGLAAYDLLSRGSPEPLMRRAPRDTSDPFALACNLLVPWSNRISHDGFNFGGRFHRLAPNWPGEPFPIHGNGFASAWKVENFAGQRARLSLISFGPGPYKYEAVVEYALEAGVLTVFLSLTSRAADPLPYGLGVHPWLPRQPDTTLCAPAKTLWFEDPRHLPKGSAPPSVRAEWDFANARRLPAAWINNCFAGWDGRATITWPERGLRLDIKTQAPITNYIVYAPSGDADFFCFEPVSHAIDAHNLPGGGEAHGLVVLAAGESLSASVRFLPAVL